jgi:hypothetical protein
MFLQVNYIGSQVTAGSDRKNSQILEAGIRWSILSVSGEI